MSKVLLPTAQTINILSHEIDTSSTARKWFAAVGSYDAQLQDGGAHEGCDKNMDFTHQKKNSRKQYFEVSGYHR